MNTLEISAREKLLAAVSRDWCRVEALVKQSASGEVEAMNLLRVIGINLQAAAQREQIPLTFLEANKDTLPPGLTFRAVKLAVHLATTHREPIRDLGDARAARQMMFGVFSASEIPRRTAKQLARIHDPWSDFVSRAASFAESFAELESDPMVDWPRERLATFVRETEPIALKYQQAKVLLS